MNGPHLPALRRAPADDGELLDRIRAFIADAADKPLDAPPSLDKSAAKSVKADADGYAAKRYEQLLKDLQSAGNAGEYYTPRAVTEFMVEMVDPKLGETILDPACGTGGFLTCSLEHLRQNYVRT